MKIALAFTVGIIAGAAGLWHVVSPAQRLFVAFCEVFVARQERGDSS